MLIFFATVSRVKPAQILKLRGAGNLCKKIIALTSDKTFLEFYSDLLSIKVFCPKSPNPRSPQNLFAINSEVPTSELLFVRELIVEFVHEKILYQLT